MPVLELETFYKNINKKTGLNHSDLGHFNVFRIEDLPISKKRKPTYNRRSFFKITLITGHSKINYADQTVEVNGNTLVFTNPTIPYFWDTLGEKQKGFFCVFTEPFFNRFGKIKDYPVFQNSDTAILPLTKKQFADFSTLFIKMESELQSNYVYKYDLLRSLLLEVIHEAQKGQISLSSVTHGSNAAERITNLFLELLERQFPIELNYQVLKLNAPSAFAEQLSVHVNHLNKSLKEITGRTTSHLIGERIIQEAKVLLKSTNWTIAEIAFSLGFEEANHFSGFFRSKTKMTARKFRELYSD